MSQQVNTNINSEDKKHTSQKDLPKQGGKGITNTKKITNKQTQKNYKQTNSKKLQTKKITNKSKKDKKKYN